MGERYQIINKEENLHDGVSPILISALAITKDQVTDGVLLQLKIKNLDIKKISSLKVKFDCFSVDNSLLETITEYQYVDVNASVNEEFGDKNAIFLEQKQVRKAVCNIVEIIYTDNSVFRNEQTITLKPVTIEKNSINTFGELQEQYIRSNKENSYTKIGEFLYVEGDSYDSCTCGEIISIHTEVCPHCNKNKKILLNFQDTAYLEIEAEKFALLVSENNVTRDEKKEKKLAKKAKRKKRRKRFWTIVLIIIIILFSFIMYNEHMIEKRESKINDMLSSNDYEGIAEYIIDENSNYHTTDMEYLKNKDLVAYKAVYELLISEIDVDVRVLMSNEVKEILDIDEEFEIENSIGYNQGKVGIGVLGIRNYSDLPMELVIEWGSTKSETPNNIDVFLKRTSWGESYHVYNVNNGKYLLAGTYNIKVYDAITEEVYIEEMFILS